VRSSAVHFVDAQGDLKLSNLTLRTLLKKKLNFTTLKFATWKAFLVILFLGNVDNVAFSLTSTSSFGFDDRQTGFQLSY